MSIVNSIETVRDWGTGPDEPARSAGGVSAQKDGQAVKLTGLGNALPVAAAARAMDIH